MGLMGGLVSSMSLGMPGRSHSFQLSGADFELLKREVNNPSSWWYNLLRTRVNQAQMGDVHFTRWADGQATLTFPTAVSPLDVKRFIDSFEARKRHVQAQPQLLLSPDPELVVFIEVGRKDHASYALHHQPAATIVELNSFEFWTQWNRGASVVVDFKIQSNDRDLRDMLTSRHCPWDIARNNFQLI